MSESTILVGNTAMQLDWEGSRRKVYVRADVQAVLTEDYPCASMMIECADTPRNRTLALTYTKGYYDPDWQWHTSKQAEAPGQSNDGYELAKAVLFYHENFSDMKDADLEKILDAAQALVDKFEGR